LRDVLDWPASEVAECLETTVPAVNSALHRARSTLALNYGSRAAAEDRASPQDERTRRLLERYVRAWEEADVAGLVALLKHDAVLLMPPSPAWFRGREGIGYVLSAIPFAGEAAGRWLLRPTRANGQPAFACYERVEPAGFCVARALHVLDLAGGEIAEIATFVTPELFPAFGLPERLGQAPA
jgi:RNA polymerase sigma-70 factor (ECF subfamily)